jgi:hypothetical protein
VCSACISVGASSGHSNACGRTIERLNYVTWSHSLQLLTYCCQRSTRATPVLFAVNPMILWSSSGIILCRLLCVTPTASCLPETLVHIARKRFLCPLARRSTAATGFSGHIRRAHRVRPIFHRSFDDTHQEDMMNSLRAKPWEAGYARRLVLL